MSWHLHAACVGTETDVFFPPMGGNGAYDEAKRICDRCPVKTECLADALENETEFRAGMYGGKTPAERDQLADQQRGIT